jgi:hypothetical protein
MQATSLTYLESNIDITWPLWIENWDGSNENDGTNDGANYVNVAKMTIFGTPT